MKRIVYLTFYFKPDLCAGSFRNSSLAIELSRQAKLKNIFIDLYTGTLLYSLVGSISGYWLVNHFWRGSVERDKKLHRNNRK